MTLKSFLRFRKSNQTNSYSDKRFLKPSSTEFNNMLALDLSTSKTPWTLIQTESLIGVVSIDQRTLDCCKSVGNPEYEIRPI